MQPRIISPSDGPQTVTGYFAGKIDEYGINSWGVPCTNGYTFWLKESEDPPDEEDWESDNPAPYVYVPAPELPYRFYVHKSNAREIRAARRGDKLAVTFDPKPNKHGNHDVISVWSARHMDAYLQPKKHSGR